MQVFPICTEFFSSEVSTYMETVLPLRSAVREGSSWHMRQSSSLCPNRDTENDPVNSRNIIEKHLTMSVSDLGIRFIKFKIRSIQIPRFIAEKIQM
jgi:hypothetical protein